MWQEPLPEATEKRLRDIFSTCGDITLFFRADDIGKPDDRSFKALLELFLAHRIPLCPAVVPTWIDGESWDAFREYQPSSSLWCWHQHGYDHINHEIHGKKAEFGETRQSEKIFSEIKKGREKLVKVMGSNFMPVFTPPWNRCGSTTLDSLLALDFKAVSRWSGGVTPAPPSGLPEFPVNVDLHTRKEKNSEDGWQALYHEMTQAGRSGYMGIMLHHLIMNRQCFLFLEKMLGVIKEYRVPCTTFRELINKAPVIQS